MKKNFLFLLFVLYFSLLSLVFSLRNPAAVYCNALGYKYIVEKTEDGDIGYCILPNKEKVNAWDFLHGKIGLEYSYCKKIGLEAKSIKNLTLCEFIDECTVCVFSNGTEIEVTKLMGLSFLETICGDNICGLPENHFNCPQDCPSGSSDLVCDKIKDGICDPDCILLNKTEDDQDCKKEEDKKICLNIKDFICEETCPEDPDCKIETTKLPYWIFLILLAATIMMIFIYYFKKIKFSKKL